MKVVLKTKLADLLQGSRRRLELSANWQASAVLPTPERWHRHNWRRLTRTVSDGSKNNLLAAHLRS